MNEHTYDRRRQGLPAGGYGEILAFGEDRHNDLLRQAEDSRIAARFAKRPSTKAIIIQVMAQLVGRLAG